MLNKIKKKKKIFYLNNLIVLDLEQSKNFLSMEKYFVKHFGDLFDKRTSNKNINPIGFKKQPKKLKKKIEFNEEFIKIELNIPINIFEKLVNILKTEDSTLSSYNANRNVFLVLKRLKTGESFRSLAYKFDVSIGLAHKIFKPTICTLLSKLHNINIKNCKLYFEDKDKIILGCIDNTTSYRDRIHPGSGTIYRTDKDGHFLTSMIVVDLFGSSILHLSIFRGHNNDKACFKLSGFFRR
jgi:hypothetical protein